MFTSLEMFKMAHAMAVHAGTRQALIAQNVANADTPGYVARDLHPFAESYRTRPGGSLRATRDAHINAGIAQGSRILELPVQTEDMNGNTVSVEDQLLNAVSAKRQHDRALAIYRNALTVLRASLGRG